MKKYKKIYAILHLTEKHTVFYLGKTKVHVSFTGGIVTKKGVTPATFATDDPIVQLAIENSAAFKKGAITLQSKYPVQGEVKIGKNPPVTVTTQLETRLAELTEEVKEEEKATPITETERPKEDDSLTVKDNDGVLIDEKSEEVSIVDEPTPEVPQGNTPQVNELQVIEVSCKDVAKQYLQEHFNENPTPLRTIANVQECASKYGITFSFV